MQAFPLKKYRGDMLPAGSKTSGKEHTLAPLRQAPELSIQLAPFEPPSRACRHPGVFPAAPWNVKPAPKNFTNHRCKVSSAVLTEEAGDVLEYDPSRICCSNKSDCLEEQA